MEIKPITCPNCGANIAIQEGVYNYTCGYCGSSVQVKRDDNPQAAQQAYPAYTVVTYGTPTITYGTPIKIQSGVWLLIMNIAMPGLGSLLGGKKTSGVWQLGLFWGGVATSWLLIGLPAMAVAYVWAFIDGLKLLKENPGEDSNENEEPPTHTQ
jgi:predicted RNA-binding Zn-ribbon protein involved in translation (DUF1610 family)